MGGGAGRRHHHHLSVWHLWRGVGNLLQRAICIRRAALLLNVSMSFNESSAEQAVANAVWVNPDLGNGRLDLYQAVSSAPYDIGQ